MRCNNFRICTHDALANSPTHDGLELEHGFAGYMGSFFIPPGLCVCMTANLLRVSTPPGTNVPAQCRISDDGEPARELSSQNQWLAAARLSFRAKKFPAV